ncbi:MAG: hypothetical protein FJ275_08160, partial [Planctomycetes bacterium]|nr:hypothetical protein [Planctomycetota bacterium]
MDLHATTVHDQCTLCQGFGSDPITRRRAGTEKVSDRHLGAATGWEVVAVPGLIASRPFFSMLANRQFPAGTFVRTPEQLASLEEPDIFHDVFGHVPLLTHPAYLSVDKALHGLCPLERPRETPRVSRV